MAGERRLGTGLKALLDRVGGGCASEPEVVSIAGSRIASPSNKIDVGNIGANPFQPRKVFDEAGLEELAQSLQTQGLLQPITVRQVGERYQIIAGERRFRAALLLGWREIPAQILDKDDRQMAELALTENLQREDLNDIEKATSFANYLETYGGTHDELAKRLEIKRATVTNILRLLKLPEQLQEAVCQGRLSTGHVRAMLSLPPLEQIEVAAKIQAEGWSVRETERFVQDLLQTGEAEDPKNPEQTWNLIDEDGKSRPVSPQSEQVQQLEDDFRCCLGGMKVKLTQTNDKGKGKLVICFANHAEFEYLHGALCGKQGHRSTG
ncbi:MAG: ParB/RepB/Spo0J family partition protein [Planctomycetaceae bacterium]|nr:ParB/RepB/Spo0J family partition protein [Planctomycetaceae bacterium]